MSMRIAGKHVAFVLGLGLSLAPSVSLAQVALPFSTTYACPEQSQKDTMWVTCDGIKGGGGWTTSNGSGEQITAAANYPLGGGGLGQRHWIGQSSGNTNNSGGVFYRFSQTVQEVYIRWYIRWQAGLKLGGDTPPISRAHKLVYFTGSYCGQPGGCYFQMEGSRYHFVINGVGYPAGMGWDSMFGGGGNAPSDGRWIMMEVHLKNATIGQNNGIVQWWVDGKLVMDHRNVGMQGSTGFSAFAFPSNHQFTTVQGACCDMYEDLDDVAIRTAGPIGPISGSSSSNLPTAPANIRIGS
jgi:hypothetical protein